MEETNFAIEILSTFLTHGDSLGRVGSVASRWVVRDSLNCGPMPMEVSLTRGAEETETESEVVVFEVGKARTALKSTRTMEIICEKDMSAMRSAKFEV